MLDLNIQALPNQQFTADLDGHRVDISIRTSIDIMVADVAVDGETLILGTRLVAGEPAIPYAYLSTWGNLVLFTQSDDLPWWGNFGITQRLYFLTAVEMAEALA